MNDAAPDAAADELRKVCSSRRWAVEVAAARPFSDGQHLQRTADEVWTALEPTDWLEALAGHPRIGEQGGSSEAHSREEQAGVAHSPDSLLAALRDGNRRYEQRFGHVFLISAAGRSAEQIHRELTRRLENTPDAEVREAAEQHRRITHLRLERNLGESGRPA